MRTIQLFILLLTISLQVIYSQQISIKDAWARPAAKGSNSALYFTAINNSINSDTLIRVESNAADIVEIHESFKNENGMIGMRAVDYVVIPSKSEIKFMPGGFHVMLIDTKKNLKIGDTVNVTLRFKHSKEIKLKATVRDVMNHMQH